MAKKPTKPPEKKPGKVNVAGPGRETLLNAQVTEAVCKGIADGLPLRHAALLGGVSERTLRYWMAHGKEGKTPETVAFLAEIKKAQAVLILKRIEIIEKAADESWQAAAWLLERMFPGDFASDRAQTRKKIAELQAEIKALRDGKATEGDIEAFINRIVQAQQGKAGVA